MTPDPWTTPAQLTPYPFSPEDPPTVEDFETALGVLAYAGAARDAFSSGVRGGYVARDQDPFLLARRHLLTMAPFLAAPNGPEDDDAEDTAPELEDDSE